MCPHPWACGADFSIWGTARPSRLGTAWVGQALLLLLKLQQLVLEG